MLRSGPIGGQDITNTGRVKTYRYYISVTYLHRRAVIRHQAQTRLKYAPIEFRIRPFPI